jgi:hypothetical protein
MADRWQHYMLMGKGTYASVVIIVSIFADNVYIQWNRKFKVYFEVIYGTSNI